MEVPSMLAGLVSKPKANILVVNDRPEQLMALEAILTTLQQNILTARSGREALEPVINFNYVGTENHFENCLYIVNTSGH
jgi:PleD family two-component response regulator